MKNTNLQLEHLRKQLGVVLAVLVDRQMGTDNSKERRFVQNCIHAIDLALLDEGTAGFTLELVNKQTKHLIADTQGLLVNSINSTKIDSPLRG